MQRASNPSQQKTQTCMKELFAILLPDQQFKSVHDLFNAQKFHKLLAALVNGMDEQFRHKLPDIKLNEDSHSQSYNDMRRKQFKEIVQNIKQVEESLGISPKRPITEKEINKMVERSSMRALHKFLEHLFEMFQYNKSLLHEITLLDEYVQQKFFQMMQTYSSLTEESEFQDSDSEISTLNISSKIKRNELDENQIAHLEEIQNELQSHIHMKEEQIKELKFGKEQLEEELDQLRREMNTKNDEIEMLKKRIISYEEIDQLMIQKDQQILKLSKKLADRQLKSRLKQSQLTNEIRNLHERVSEFQSKQLEIVSKYQKQKQHIQLINKQKEESETSMKKVINNLKEKNKSFMDKINDLQKQLIEANFEKQMKDKQLNQLKNTFIDSKKPINTNIFDSLQSPRSALKQDLNEQLGSVRGNYSKLGQQLSIDLDRADFEDDFGVLPKQNNKRFNELLQENYMLKKQLNKMQSSSSLDSKQCKDLQDEVQKMKKKINILKRRNDEIENQRKEEIDVMVGIMELYASSLEAGHGMAKK